jgi:hypothetical protein
MENIWTSDEQNWILGSFVFVGLFLVKWAYYWCIRLRMSWGRIVLVKLRHTYWLSVEDREDMGNGGTDKRIVLKWFGENVNMWNDSFLSEQRPVYRCAHMGVASFSSGICLTLRDCSCSSGLAYVFQILTPWQGSACTHLQRETQKLTCKYQKAGSSYITIFVSKSKVSLSAGRH